MRGFSSFFIRASRALHESRTISKLIVVFTQGKYVPLGRICPSPPSIAVSSPPPVKASSPQPQQAHYDSKSSAAIAGPLLEDQILHLQQERLEIQLQLDEVKARLKLLQEDVLTTEQENAGTASPQFKKKRRKLRTLWRKHVSKESFTTTLSTLRLHLNACIWLFRALLWLGAYLGKVRGRILLPSGSALLSKKSGSASTDPGGGFSGISAFGGGGLVSYADSQPEHGTGAVEPYAGAGDVKKKRVLVLGTGWAGISFLKDLDISSYDVQVVSPRNYFAFTPLLPSVTCGTVEARSIIEPVRNIIKKKTGEIQYLEAECIKIDAANKRVVCRSNDDLFPEKGEFLLDYDYLVVAMGAQVNTFNTPGVSEHCHFLKDVEDAQRIRKSVIYCFEKASMPNLSEEERRTHLHFVIVGGGPTGVEFAAELHDYVQEDLVKLYPKVQDLMRITVIQSGDHILNTFDQRISSFAEQKFQRDGIEVKTGCRVVAVSDKAIDMKVKSKGETLAIPYGMIVWSTGVGTRPVVRDYMEQIGQTKQRTLRTDEWLRVEGCDNVYALGDCATINQRKVKEDIATIFAAADKDNSGTLTVKEFQDVIDDILVRYPQVNLYLRSKHLRSAADLLNDAQGNGRKEVDIEGFKQALSLVDSQMKSLPATAQVAAQQGAYLARCFNHMEQSKLNPEGPLRFGKVGRHQFRPFQYKHFGQFAPLGGEQTAAELPGDWVSMGHSTQWLWYSVYASKQVSWRTRVLVVSDWTRKFIFGRDSSGL